MRFTVLPVRRRPTSERREQAFLTTDDWDDFGYKTLYFLTYVDHDGVRHDIGDVKIGRLDMPEDYGRAELPGAFEELPDGYFSLGQDDTYYSNLNELGEDVRDSILDGLFDLARDPALFSRARQERITGMSLLRSVSSSSVLGQFRRLAFGGVRLSEYSFSYVPPETPDGTTSPLTFAVEPESEPPTNIHVLIGRNGVGKTRLLNLMTRALVEERPDMDVGRFDSEAEEVDDDLFANLVSVSFSAFDDFEPLPEPRNRENGTRYTYVGLKKVGKTAEGRALPPKTPGQLSAEFVKSMRICRIGARASRWRRALEMLEADPIFADADIASIAEASRIDEDDTGLLDDAPSSIFRRLSSGHKIVLLTITRLVETVEERTLVLLDEPEAHLHPPLLSAFVRSLSDLLIDRNGVAMIATHSPVVLQEVPKSCIWKVRRSGVVMAIDRPEIETFGENVGILTGEVFGLEVTQSGFHRLLSTAIDEEGNYEDVVDRFSGQLGGEALALIRALVADRRALRDMN